MAFGLGSKKIEKTKDNNSSAKSQSDEAAEMLKKMEEKKTAGDCPFC